MNEYQICTRCVMDTSDPGISFDGEGHCSFCNAYLVDKQAEGYRQGVSEKRLESIVAAMKKAGKHKAYDAVLGLSGGVDSAYLLYLAKQLGLRVLAVHVDTGWNSEIAVRNIERMCRACEVQLHTVVLDWPSMKELQRAYMLSGVANLDVPQDHAFMSVLRTFARKHRVKYLLSGSNIATEGKRSPFSLQQSYMDTRHMKSIYQRHGRGISLRKYPMLPFVRACIAQLRTRTATPLNDVAYSKTEAIDILSRKFGWEYYGGKHFESRFTKYFQSVYLPQKYGYDKRRHHLSCLVMNGEIAREDALEELARPSCPATEQKEDEAFILKKLEIPSQAWQDVLSAPPTPNSVYPSNEKWIGYAKRMLAWCKSRE